MNIFKRVGRLAAGAVVLAVTLSNVAALPASAADLSIAPALESITRTSPANVFERQAVQFRVVSAVPDQRITGEIYLTDSLGGSHSISFRDGLGSDTITANWPSGRVTLRSVYVSNGYGSVSFNRSGGFSKSPLGIKDPVLRDLKMDAFDFTISPLMKYTSTPKPKLIGAPTVDKPFSVTTSPWTPSGAKFEYEWTDEYGTPFMRSAEPTHTPGEAEIGMRLRVTVIALKDGFEEHRETSELSEPTIRPFTSEQPATVKGLARVGETLTVDPGAMTPTPQTLSYQWKRNGAAISGATGPTFVPTVTDAGKTITVTITAKANGWTPLVKTSSPTASVQNIFSLAPRPTISGTKRVGQTLTAKSSAWTPLPSTLTYAWFRDGVAISGATATTYKLTTSDLAKKITVRTTARKSGYAATSRDSVPTSAIETNTLTAPRPTIPASTTVKVGQVLSARAGVWAPTGVTFSYQWKRNGVPIAGAASESYKVVSADTGSAISVVVTGRKSGYLTKTVTSYSTAVVTK